MSIITLTTDFGADDHYVAAMKGVILSLNPQATIVDITHAIPPQDVRACAFALLNAAPPAAHPLRWRANSFGNRCWRLAVSQ